MLRVVIVTQDELVNARLSKVLASHPDVEVVGTSGDGLAALDLVWDRQPNVVIVGVLGPPLGGGVLLRLVKAAFPNALLVVLADSELDLSRLPKAAAAYLVHDPDGTLELNSRMESLP